MMRKYDKENTMHPHKTIPRTSGLVSTVRVSVMVLSSWCSVSHSAPACDISHTPTLTLPAVWAKPTGPAGEVLATRPGSGATEFSVSCTGLDNGVRYGAWYRGGQATSPVTGYDRTNNDGAYVRIETNAGTLTGLGGTDKQMDSGATLPSGGRLTRDWTNLRGSLIRSSNALTNDDVAGLHGLFIIKGSDGSEIPAGVFTVSARVSLISAPTCIVDPSSSAVSVNMNLHNAYDIERDGVTPWENFKLTLNCSGGSTGGQTAVHITLTDQNNPGNTTTELPLSGTYTAGGVAVQVSRRVSGNPLISFGPDSSSIGGAGQWRAGYVNFGTPSFEIPLSARYIQTGPITPGIAQAVATFTMAYD